MQGQMKKLLLCLLVIATGVFSLPLSAEVQLTSGKYYETVEDLRIKVLGGFVLVNRTWFDGRWQLNRRWNPLILHYDNLLIIHHNTLNSSLRSIERNGDTYERADSAGTVFRFDKRKTITVTANGFRWQDRQGNWIDYDKTGRFTAYGDRNNVRVSMIYDAAGHLTGVSDHHGVQVLWLENDANGRVLAVRDQANRRVQYQYTGQQLTTVTDVLGHEWRYQYDGQGRLTGKTDAEGRQTTITYSNTGMVSSIKDQNGVGTAYSYADDNVQKLFNVQVKTSGGRIDEYWYNREGYRVRHDLNGKTLSSLVVDARKHTHINELGQKTIIEYDEWYNPQKIIYPDGSYVTYEYDRYSNVTRFMNEKGVVTLNQYDEHGNLIRRTEAVGTPVQRVTEYTRDSYGYLLMAKRLADAVTAEAVISLTYSNQGNVLTWTDPENYNHTYTYDIMGNPLTYQDGRGKIWTYVYDAAGYLLQDINPLGYASRYEYDKVGNLTKEINALNKVTRYEYDHRNNPIQQIDAYDNIFSLTYDADNHLTSVTDEEGIKIQIESDNDGRLRKLISSSGTTIALEYGQGENNIASTMLAAVIYPTYTETYEYDSRGRRTAAYKIIENNQKLKTSITYDKTGNMIANTDELNRTVRTDYDSLNRPSVMTNAMGYTLKYVYDNRDNIINVINPKNIAIRHFEYDRNNHKTREIWPGGETFRWNYDGNGNQVTIIDGKGQVTKMTYDEANRLIMTKYFEDVGAAESIATTQLTYDALGNLLSYNDGNTAGTYQYDDLQRKISEIINYGPFASGYSYEYYSNGLKKAFTGPDQSRVGYTYDTDNRLTRIDLPEEGSIVFNRYRWFDPEQITLPGGTVRTYDYDALMHPIRMTAKNPAGQSLMDYFFVYDPVGNIVQKQTEHGDYLYEYDRMDQLVKADNPTLPDEFFTYDPVGNRLTDALDSNWTYNDQDQLLSHGDIAYTYDSNGDLVEKNQAGQVLQYQYVKSRQISQISNGAESAVAYYSYDPFGRRLTKTVNGSVTYYLYSDEGLVGEYDATGQLIKNYGYNPVSSKIFEPVFSKQNYRYFYYHNDHLGTPQKISDNNGVISWSSVYDSFGKGHIGNNFFNNNLRFPGQYYDSETGFHYNFARYYDPMSGRYIATDPIGTEGGLESVGEWMIKDLIGIKGGINTYAYVESNPVNKIDPRGLYSINLLSKDDPLRKMVENLDSPNACEVAGHSKLEYPYVRGIYNLVDARKTTIFDFIVGPLSLTPRDLAKIIKNDPQCSGKPVVLYSCNAGTGNNSFAQKLANILKVRVSAPDGYYVPGEDKIYKYPEWLRDLVLPFRDKLGRWRSFLPTDP